MRKSPLSLVKKETSALSPFEDFDVRSAHDILDARVLRAALERNAFNRLAAAKELGIHKTTLFRRMKKLGISLPERDGRSRRARIQ
jgi:transcriptional regulator with PAS, ATPase and Fis domain